MKRVLMLSLAMTCLTASAQNPVIGGLFSADPTAQVFNDKLYLYPSHDIPAPEGVRQDWFCMADYHVFSSSNLTDWTDHGVIVTQNNVPWVKPDSYAMWAPDCVCKNGTYYFYFPASPAGKMGFGVGVATASSPEGPFTCEAQPIEGISGIDPCVLIDDDGQAYIYWSGRGLRGARLKSNMKELDGEITTTSFNMQPPTDNQDTTSRENHKPVQVQMRMGGQEMEGLPEGFKEGPFAFKQGGHYYLTFPWVRKEGGTETLAYAMADSPLGPWTFKGVFMAEHENGCWTNHHSIVQYHGEWYLFYHRNDYSPSFDKLRSVCIDRISFRADGTINEVKPTLRGVGTSLATSRIEVDRYSETGGNVTTAYNDTLQPFRGWHASLLRRGSWFSYDNVDFSPLHNDAYITANIKATTNTTLFVRERNAKGRIIASLPIKVETDGQFRRSYRGQWLTVTAPLQYIPRGVTDICITAANDSVSIDWLQFKNRPDYFSQVEKGSVAQPDADGFIRRWMLLEPITKPNRTNNVFTYAYLDEHLARQEYFPQQFTILPRDGQTVKAGKQKLAWHSLESNTFNIKLFRFAEKWGEQTYGSLFWAVTIIDSPEELHDVRLAAGSNGASMWWLNGQQVLTLEGDRRMVKDDGMSPRLTLKKGRNILRCAVINGPGLSDFCVRFIAADGSPVTNLNIH